VLSQFPLLLWLLYKIRTISRASFYPIDGFVDILVDTFSSLSLFKDFSTLMLHEIEYLIFSAYVIIFIISIFFIVTCLFRLKVLGINDWLQQFSQGKVLALRSVILYCMTFSAGLLLISVIFMQQWGVPSIYGRYIDPVVPAIFIFGIIGIGSLFTKNAGPKWWTELFLALGITILFISVYTLPDTFTDAFPNDFGIYYIICLQDFMRNTLLMVLFLAVFLILIPWYLLKNSQKENSLITFFAFFIVLSVIFSLPIYEVRSEYMAGTERVNQIGRYLQEHSSSDAKILMDSDGPIPEQKYFRSLTQFWIDGRIIQESTANDPSGVLTKEFVDKSDYIVSKKLLPFPCVIASTIDYKLYSPHPTDQFVQNVSLPSVIYIGNDSSLCIINGFYLSEGTFRWTSNFSEVKIEYPKEKGSFLVQVMTGGDRPEKYPANVTFFINGHFIGSMEKTSGIKTYTAIIPEYYLENDYQILGIRTNPWRPSEYGSSDSRELGVTVEWIQLNDISFEGMYDMEYWNSVPTRWMSNNATFSIYSDENRSANFTFRAVSFYQPRTLEIYNNDKLQTTINIFTDGVTNVSAPLLLQKGKNTIRLHTPERCNRPSDVPELTNNDTRCLSIAVQNVTFS